MKQLSTARWPWIVIIALVLASLTVAALGDPGPVTVAERSRSLAESIKCPQCVGQSVADSDASAARAIRTDINRRLTEGQTDDEIRDAFASRYGEEILLTPNREGVNALVWFLPVAFGVGALGGLIGVFRHWRAEGDAVASDADRVLVEQALRNDG
jgi:cytochrome c-type biogenesis protein CcmH/NrfF